jgi:hypothetical protein
MLHVGIEGQQQCRACVDDADPRVAVAVPTAFVAFGVSTPAFQVEGVPRQVRLLTSDKQARSKARPHCTPVLPERVGTALALRLQRLALRLSLRARAAVQVEGGWDGLHFRHLAAHVRLGGLHGAQPPVNVAGQPCESVISSPPLGASRCRWSDARLSPRASAMRMPGGWRGPP